MIAALMDEKPQMGSHWLHRSAEYIVPSFLCIEKAYALCGISTVIPLEKYTYIRVRSSASSKIILS